MKKYLIKYNLGFIHDGTGKQIQFDSYDEAFKQMIDVIIDEIKHNGLNHYGIKKTAFEELCYQYRHGSISSVKIVVNLYPELLIDNYEIV